MSALDFQFVQGSERLDWGVLVTIDVQRLVKDTNVDTLQRVVENIAFARVTRDEAAMFTPDHFIHLFTLCQLIIQYLVCSQECLSKMNVKLSERLRELQQQCQSLEDEGERLRQENSLLRKEIKAQRRTLLAYEYSKGVTSGQAHACPHCGEMYGKSESLQSHIRKRHMKHVDSPSTCHQGQSPAATNLPLANQNSEALLMGQQQQLKHLQERLDFLEHMLDKERERNDRLQQDNMVKVVQAVVATKAGESKEEQEAQREKQNEPLKREEPQVGLPTVRDVSVGTQPLGDANDSLTSIPIMPDVAALQQYNLTRQQETFNSALVRQIAELESVVRGLKSAKSEPVEPHAVSLHAEGEPSVRSTQPSWLTVRDPSQSNVVAPVLPAVSPNMANTMPPVVSPAPMQSQVGRQHIEEGDDGHGDREGKVEQTTETEGSKEQPLAVLHQGAVPQFPPRPPVAQQASAPQIVALSSKPDMAIPAVSAPSAPSLSTTPSPPATAREVESTSSRVNGTSSSQQAMLPQPLAAPACFTIDTEQLSKAAPQVTSQALWTPSSRDALVPAHAQILPVPAVQLPCPRQGSTENSTNPPKVISPASVAVCSVPPTTADKDTISPPVVSPAPPAVPSLPSVSVLSLKEEQPSPPNSTPSVPVPFGPRTTAQTTTPAASVAPILVPAVPSVAPATPTVAAPLIQPIQPTSWNRVCDNSLVNPATVTPTTAAHAGDAPGEGGSCSSSYRSPSYRSSLTS
ncbi:hypothetical protein TRVL_04047 [Trypanosoma vivax]|nr:hypothetical protein TRVL_04047 [Trypanosoma vivax]